MSLSTWQRENCSPGRDYLLSSDLTIKYDDAGVVIPQIMDALRNFVHAEPAVRLNIDTPSSNPERAILAIPFKSDADLLLRNFATIIHQSLIGYYLSGEPLSTHFGISNLSLEGNLTSFLKREMEKLIAYFQTRGDIAGRLLKDVTVTPEYEVPGSKDAFLAETLRKGLNIAVGYRVVLQGEDVNCARIFLPLPGNEVLENHIYFNLEKIIQQNFVTYDETGDTYLRISDTLVFKELGAVIQRSREKEITRNKILANLAFTTTDGVTTPDFSKDRVYDLLNQVQDSSLQKATQGSRDLFNSYLSQTGALKLDAEPVKVALPSRAGEEGALPVDAATQSGTAAAGEKVEARGALDTDGETVVPRRKLLRRRPGNPAVDSGRLVRRRGTQVPAPSEKNIEVPTN